MAITPDDGGGGGAQICNPPNVTGLAAAWVVGDCIITWNEVRMKAARYFRDYRITLNGVSRIVCDPRLFYHASLNKQDNNGTLATTLDILVKARHRFFGTFSRDAASLTSVRPAGGAAGAVTLGWYIDGTLTVANALGPILRLDRNVEVTGVTLTIKTAPVGASVVGSVETASAPTGPFSAVVSASIAAGSNSGSGSASLNLDIDTYLRFNVTQIGNTTPGAGLAAQLRMTER